jgi:hypothetical protein
MAVLTHKQQSVARPIGSRRMPTHRTRLTAVMGINLDSHTTCTKRLVGNHAMQFGKAPFRVGGIGLSLLLRGLLATASLRAFANMGQIL